MTILILRASDFYFETFITPKVPFSLNESPRVRNIIPNGNTIKISSTKKIKNMKNGFGFTI